MCESTGQPFPRHAQEVPVGATDTGAAACPTCTVSMVVRHQRRGTAAVGKGVQQRVCLHKVVEECGCEVGQVAGPGYMHGRAYQARLICSGRQAGGVWQEHVCEAVSGVHHGLAARRCTIQPCQSRRVMMSSSAYVELAPCMAELCPYDLG